MKMKLFSKAGIVLLFWIVFLLITGGAYLYFTAVEGDWLGLFGGMPSLRKLEDPPSQVASEIFSADGVSLGKFFKQNRSEASIDEISPYLLKALYATEDIRFESHSGIDFRGTFRVLIKSLILGDRGSGGGSTITQQLAKNFFETRDSSYYGKLNKIPKVGTLIIKTKEWLTSIRLEQSYTKREIVTMYLNAVDFGSNAFGIKAASQTFFGKEPMQLNIQEAAMLVGLLKAPTKFSPKINPNNALERRNVVIQQMRKYKFLTPAQADSIKKLPIELNYKVESHNYGIATYFRATIQKDLEKICDSLGIDLYGSGLKIYTSIDSRMQAFAEAAIEKHMADVQQKFTKHWGKQNPWVNSEFKEIPNFIEIAVRRSTQYYSLLHDFNRDTTKVMKFLNTPRKMKLFDWRRPDYTFDTIMTPYDSARYAKRFLHAGLLSVNPHNGHIKAWVGGINFRHFKFDHVKQSRRQPGSTFKAFVYTAAIDNGFSPCYPVTDEPITFYLGHPDPNDPTKEAIWQPKNAEGRFTGETYTLRKALAQSLNSASGHLMQKLGPELIVKYARRLGVTSPLDPVPALCLGSSDVSLYELTGAYSTFANEGVHIKPFYILRIEDKHGNLIKRFSSEKSEAISPATAYLMLYMLMGTTQERNGTALGLYRLGSTLLGNQVAAKTGTTSDHADGWFMGITKDLVTGVWVGGEDPVIRFRDFNLGQGARLAMPIWSLYMDKVYATPSLKIEKGYFDKPKVELPYSLDCSQVNDTSAQNNNQPDPSQTIINNFF